MLTNVNGKYLTKIDKKIYNKIKIKNKRKVKKSDTRRKINKYRKRVR